MRRNAITPILDTFDQKNWISCNIYLFTKILSNKAIKQYYSAIYLVFETRLPTKKMHIRTSEIKSGFSGSKFQINRSIK